MGRYDALMAFLAKERAEERAGHQVELRIEAPFYEEPEEEVEAPSERGSVELPF